MVKSMRKVLTIVLSFVLFPKTVSYKYYLGGVAVLLSLAATHELQRRKGGDVKPATHPEAIRDVEVEPLSPPSPRSEQDTNEKSASLPADDGVRPAHAV